MCNMWDSAWYTINTCLISVISYGVPGAGDMFFSWWRVRVKEPEPDHAITHFQFLLKCSVTSAHMPFTEAGLMTNAWVTGKRAPSRECKA